MFIEDVFSYEFQRKTNNTLSLHGGIAPYGTATIKF